MTVVLAVRCADGLVFGADSQITDSARGMSYPAQKLHDLGDHAAWGGSGARAVLRDVEAVFEEQAGAILESGDVARAVQERVLPILRHHYHTFIPDVPGEEGGGTPAAYVLAAGYQGDTPFMVEINPNGMIGRYEDVGYHAIGSGAAMAQQAGTLLAHFEMHERPVEYGVLTVVRVLDALKLTAPSVGDPIDVCRVTPGGKQHLQPDEIDAVRKGVRRWIELEQRALDDLFD